MTNLAYFDLETVSLDPDDDVIWEIGLIQEDEGKPRTAEWRWQVRPNISKLSEWSRPDFEHRFCVPDGVDALQWDPLDPDGEGMPCAHKQVAHMLVSLTHKRHIVGAVPDFDTWRGRFYVQRHIGLAPTWHYHLRDVENLAVGWLKGVEEGRRLERGAQLALGRTAARVLSEKTADRPAWLQPDGSWKSDDLYRAVGVDPDGYARHTALGDCRLNRDVYRKVWGL